MRAKKYTGSCLCGATRYSFVGKLDDLCFCHCSQCRKNYGLYGAFVGVTRSKFKMRKRENLQSFKSSKSTTRTFCCVCGSGIAWDRKGYERIYVLAGTLDGTIRIKGGKHIFTEDRGRYYKACL
jgi:hypothetical protein